MDTLPIVPDEAPEQRGGLPPPLPIETHIVGAARALEAAKLQADAALTMLQYAPRSVTDAASAIVALQHRAGDALNAYRLYCELMDCRGQG